MMFDEREHMLQVSDEKIPLSQDKSGNVFVGETRVMLDCLVEMFDLGASPKEIAAEYDSVLLPDVYAVLTYYLRHQDEVKGLPRQAGPRCSLPNSPARQASSSKA